MPAGPANNNLSNDNGHSMSHQQPQQQLPLHEPGEPQSPSVASRSMSRLRQQQQQLLLPPAAQLLVAAKEAAAAASSSAAPALEMTRSTSSNRLVHAVHSSHSSHPAQHHQHPQHSSAGMSVSQGGLADQFSSSLASIASHSRNHRSAAAGRGSSSDSNSSSSDGTGAAVVTGSSSTPATHTSSSGGSGGSGEDHRMMMMMMTMNGSSRNSSGSGSGSDNGSSGNHMTMHSDNLSAHNHNSNNSGPAVTASASSNLTSSNLLLNENNNSNHAKNSRSSNHAANMGETQSALTAAARYRLHHSSSRHHGSGVKQQQGDDYGLPVPMDDRLGDAASKQAAVVARFGRETTSNTIEQGARTYHAIVRIFKKLPKGRSASNAHRAVATSNGNDPTAQGGSSSNKKKRKKRSKQEDSSGESSGEADTKYKNPNKHHHHRHHHHHDHVVLKRAPPGTSPAMDKEGGTDASGNSKTNKKMSASHYVGRISAMMTAQSSSYKKNKTSGVAKPQQKLARKRSSGLPSLVGDPAKAVEQPVVHPQDEDDDAIGCDSNNEANGSNSSGSGSEAGYAGSASNNENNATSSSSNSSDIPDFSSGASETNASEQEGMNGLENANEVGGFTFSPSNSPSLSSSSTGDGDASSGSDYDDRPRKFAAMASVKPAAASMLDAATSAPPPRKRARTSSTAATWPATAEFAKITRIKPRPQALLKDDRSERTAVAGEPPASKVLTAAATTALTTSESLYARNLQGKPPIMQLGSDLMAHVLTFLEPPDILQVLTMPLSKDWQLTFCSQQELWRVLCLLEPFKALVEDVDFSSTSSSSGSDDDGSLSSFSTNLGGGASWKIHHGHRRPKKIGRYRLLYTSFVRCMRYLAQIKDDVIHGRPPTTIDYGVANVAPTAIGANRSLHNFFAGARGIVAMHQAAAGRGLAVAGPINNDDAASEDSDMEAVDNSSAGAAAADDAVAPQVPPGVAPRHAAARVTNLPILSADDGSHSYRSSHEEKRRRKRKNKNREQKHRKKPKYGRSMLTDRLLAPAPNGAVNPANIDLPWSCALYSIVNWMVAFADVEGIQIMCLKVLPYLLEDEQQRITAQRVGLTDVVLRGMILFPDSVALHTASFHTIVLLARPLGGREGMLFHSSMVNSAGIFSGGRDATGMFTGGAHGGRNGIAVMLDSMRRFADDEALQAMSCWSLVNIALAPVQKEVLVKLGGIEVTANAMMRHPHNAEVQFRALFALINLVIPSVNLPEDGAEDQQNRGDVSEGITEELDEMVAQISDLVVLAMKNFCASEAILNRACLVLHNLSLTQSYHTTLLWTPNCYQMLEWCLANYRTDQVLQQSAAGTLHRLQVTLSNDDILRARFAASIQAQQQLSLEAAHREALHIYEQQEQLRQQREGAGEPGA